MLGMDSPECFGTARRPTQKAKNCQTKWTPAAAVKPKNAKQ
jgi:hypothetical protein